MSFDQDRSRETPETQNRSLEQMHGYCLAEADANFVALTDQLNRVDGRQAAALTEAVELRAQAAWRQDNAEAMGRCVDIVTLLPIEDKKKIPTYLTAISLGNQLANDLMGTILQAEETASLDEEYPATPLLRETISRLTQKEVPVFGWIECHALNTQHAQDLMLLGDGLLSREKEGKSMELHTFYRQRLEESLAALLQSDESPTFIAIQTAKHLDEVKDPELREQLVEHHVYQVTQQERINLSHFWSHVCIACEVAIDERLQTDERLEFFDKTISMWAPAFREAGVDPYLMEGIISQWEISRQLTKDKSSAALIRCVDNCISRMFNTDIPESGENGRDKDYVASGREEYLRSLAVDAANDGRLVDAKELVLEMAQSEAAFGELAKKVTTEEDLQTITPDLLTLDFKPELSFYLSAAEAVLADNRDRVLELGQEVAASQADDQRKWYRLDHLYSRLGEDLSAAHYFAQCMREKNSAVLIDSQLGQAIIKSGDEAAAERAVSDINRLSDQTLRLVYLLRLATLIDERN